MIRILSTLVAVLFAAGCCCSPDKRSMVIPLKTATMTVSVQDVDCNSLAGYTVRVASNSGPPYYDYTPIPTKGFPFLIGLPADFLVLTLVGAKEGGAPIPIQTNFWLSNGITGNTNFIFRFDRNGTVHPNP